MNSLLQNKNKYLFPVCVVFLGFALRYYSFFHTYAINQDGMLYIQQAKSFHYGFYGSLTECYPFLNSLFLLISVSYTFFGDWLTAAKAVSLFFSTLTMIPLYFLLRRFLDFPVAVCTLLVFAVNPILIEMSSKVIRGPSCWFFLTVGIYFFTLLDIKKNYFILPLACISFLLASLARFETIVLIPASIAYLLFTPQKEKWKKIGFFLAPLVVITLSALSALSFRAYDLKQLIYPRSLWQPFVLVAEKYHLVRQGLFDIGVQQADLLWSRYFFPKVSNLLWWLGLGAVVVEIVKTFFEPFFLFFVFGLKGLRSRIKEERSLVYLFLLSGATFLLLYIHVLGHWIMRERFVVFFLLPSFVLVGFGLQNIFSFLCKKYKVKDVNFYLFSGLVIFITALPKNLDENRANMKIFQDIGSSIAVEDNTGKIVNIAAAFDRDDIQIVSFFANLPTKESPCIPKLAQKIDPHAIFKNTEFLQRNNTYLIWDEKNWTLKNLERLRKEKEISCVEMKQWNDPQFGKLILFKIEV